MLRYLAKVFIDTFGITHPSPDGIDRAARYIALLLIMLLLLLCGVIGIALHVIPT
jgi:hypothetical protein